MLKGSAADSKAKLNPTSAGSRVSFCYQEGLKEFKSAGQRL